MTHYRIHEALPSRFNGGYGIVYVVELNPPELLKWACLHGVMAAQITGHLKVRKPDTYMLPNSRCRLVLRHWRVGRYRKKTRGVTIAMAEDLINRLKAGEEVKPDYERKGKR